MATVEEINRTFAEKGIDLKLPLPGDWLVITGSDGDTANFSAWDGVSGAPITIVDRKRLTGTITLGDYYDLYCGNSITGLGLGANNRIYPCGTLYFD